MAAERTAERHQTAMGSDVSVVVTSSGGVDANALVERGLRRLVELERRWSRFDPGSEVSRLNRHVGHPVETSTDTITLVRAAAAAWRESGGFVDATELAALVDAGYDRSFELLLPNRPVAPASTHTVNLLGPADIVVDGTTVTLPVGTTFDPGGIGKGLAADLVAADLVAAGADGVCIDVGGDLRVQGRSPSGDGWTISVDHPHHDEPLAMVGLADGAVASSTTLRRRWMVDGKIRHHLIDPRTGSPATSDIEFATAITDTGWRAEALAKAVLIRGGRSPFELLDDTSAAALIVRTDGAIETSPSWHHFTRHLPEEASAHDTKVDAR